jgi:AcrR family transcriptional regulator
MKTTNKNMSLKSKTSKELKKEEILRAAKKVFSNHPYGSASMRMIAREAHVDHPLIIYYFSTKADLFQQILKDLKEEFTQALPNWFQGIGEMGLVDGVSTYLDRALNFYRKHPELLRVILLNMTQSVKKNGLIPGYQVIQAVFNFGAKVIGKSSRFRIKPEQMVSMVKG